MTPILPSIYSRGNAAAAAAAPPAPAFVATSAGDFAADVPGVVVVVDAAAVDLLAESPPLVWSPAAGCCAFSAAVKQQT